MYKRQVQILKRFDIMTDFKTKKSTKRLYSAVVGPEIKNFMFSLYNLLELQDYRSLPSRYRYFYLELSKMVYLIKMCIRDSPYAEQCRQTPTHYILVHSAIEYFIRKQ